MFSPNTTDSTMAEVLEVSALASIRFQWHAWFDMHSEHARVIYCDIRIGKVWISHNADCDGGIPCITYHHYAFDDQVLQCCLRLASPSISEKLQGVYRSCKDYEPELSGPTFRLTSLFPLIHDGIMAIAIIAASEIDAILNPVTNSFKVEPSSTEYVPSN